MKVLISAEAESRAHDTRKKLVYEEIYTAWYEISADLQYKRKEAKEETKTIYRRKHRLEEPEEATKHRKSTIFMQLKIQMRNYLRYPTRCFVSPVPHNTSHRIRYSLNSGRTMRAHLLYSFGAFTANMSSVYIITLLNDQPYFPS